MRRLTRILTRIYPPAWRSRYEAEFNALLDDLSPAWRTALNVVVGALAVQVGTRDLRRTVTVFGLIGLMTGCTCWLVMPNQYRSTAIIAIQSSGGLASSRLVSSALQALTSRLLHEIIQKDKLYPAKQGKMPLEDIAADMAKSLQVRAVDGSLLAIEFDYTDPFTAQSVTNDLVSSFVDETLEINFKSGSTGVRTLSVLNSGSLAKQPIYWNPVSLAIVGLLGGIVVGLAVPLIRRASVSYLGRSKTPA
jgi:capsular polysaccharide biosynthesis protein